MNTILSFFGPNGIFWALGAIIVVTFLGYVKSLGKRDAEAKQAREEARARDISDDVQNDVGAMTPKQRREALREWAP